MHGYYNQLVWWFLFANVIKLHVDIAVWSFLIVTVCLLFSHNSHSNTVSLPAVGGISCIWEIIVCCVLVITDVSEIHMRKTCKSWFLEGLKGKCHFQTGVLQYYLPHSLLHIFLINEACRVERGCHHKPEGHSLSLTTHNDVWHAGPRRQ